MKWPTSAPPSQASAAALLRATAAKLAARVQQANALQREGRFDEAETIYLGVLKADPVNADARHFLGVLRVQQGRLDEAQPLIEAALQQAPDYVDAWNSLGNLHRLRNQGGEARRCYEQVLARNARHPQAWHNLALALQVVGELDRAAQCFRALLQLEPDNHGTRRNLGALLYVQGKIGEAEKVYREWVALQPDDPIARHFLASCGGEVAPERAADDYVRATFDRFASSFDTVLVERLKYVAPQRLAEALLPQLGPAARALEILDAGCGTGLCGPLLREHAAHLAGVDLSAAMLALAQPRGYDVLVNAELGEFLGRSAERWEVIVSADTLVYFGDLRSTLRSAALALRPGGWLAFTLENLAVDEDLARLSPSGRYQHSRRHVEAALAEAGLQAVRIDGEALRKEKGQPVPGWVVVARKAQP